MIDFSKYQFRASQASKLLVGTIGITELQEVEIGELMQEMETGINVNGNKVKWTDNKQKKLNKLVEARDNPTLPKTVETELRKIYRSEVHNRNFEFTNKFVQKGTSQEEEGITLLQEFLNGLGIRVFFKKNEKQFKKGMFRGTPDLLPEILKINDKKVKVGFDIKCSWHLKTFPFEKDKLDIIYDTQNRVYTKITESDMWITAYVLVNINERQLHNEKMTYFYAMGAPELTDDKYAEYVKKAKAVERDLIFDYKQFRKNYPNHILEYGEEEWMEEGNDVPLSKRVVLKPTFPNEGKWAELEERALIGRKHLVQLQEESEAPESLLKIANFTPQLKN